MSRMFYRPRHAKKFWTDERIEELLNTLGIAAVGLVATVILGAMAFL